MYRILRNKLSSYIIAHPRLLVFVSCSGFEPPWMRLIWATTSSKNNFSMKNKDIFIHLKLGNRHFSALKKSALRLLLLRSCVTGRLCAWLRHLLTRFWCPDYRLSPITFEKTYRSQLGSLAGVPSPATILYMNFHVWNLHFESLVIN